MSDTATGETCRDCDEPCLNGRVTCDRHTAARHRRSMGRMAWLEITDVGRARLAEHLRAGLAPGDDSQLRGFVASFVASLEG